MDELKVNAIYKHWKGNYYRVTGMAHHHDTGEAVVIYHRCNEYGIFQSIRYYDSRGDEQIVPQPFFRPVMEFINGMFDPETHETVPRFKLFKHV